MRGSKARIGLVSVAMVCALLPLATAGSPALASGVASTEASSPKSHPNVLLIVSDDQAWSTFSRDLMPSVYSQLVDQGVLFKRAYVNTSLCCPSRAQIVSGLYEHDTGVDQNEVLLTRPTLPMALHDVGYRTMLAGKYMNSWPCDPRAEFDRWACVATPEISSLSLVDPMVNIDGVWQRRTGYEPDVLGSLASDFIEQTPADQPFFVMYTPTTPHLPADDARYADMPVSPPRGPAFDVNTMTPATPPYSRRPPLTKDEIAISDDHYTSMAHATRSFDDAVDSLLGSLGDRAQDTIVIYLSDNGFLYGEHRRTGKNDPWEGSVNVPMVVRYPAALPANRAFVSDALVQNVDLASTIADAVGLQWGGDGRSFLPVIERKKRTVRTAALIEHCRGVSRGIPDCSGYGTNGARIMTPGFQGVVTERYKYVEFDDGSRQLIDLKKDPHELHDLSRNPGSSALRRAMASKLHAL
ncbi:MAG: sulfatase-like hydrolase/transferase, partial [Actinomycetota bacterium]